VAESRLGLEGLESPVTSRRTVQVSIPAEAVLQQLALAQLETGPGDRVGHWRPSARDRALQTLEAQAALGHERAAATWAALVQAAYDVEFADHLDAPDEPGGGRWAS
jgi:hypothetical protein